VRRECERECEHCYIPPTTSRNKKGLVFRGCLRCLGISSLHAKRERFLFKRIKQDHDMSIRDAVRRRYATAMQSKKILDGVENEKAIVS
jgi:hypothetical protein